MAKATFINATLSGKLAGTVYARNRAGFYVRQLVKPINPQSIRQQINRISFSAASQAYHSLSDGIKSLWQTFANTKFVPKFSSPGFVFSAINAFTALNNVVSSFNRSQIGVPIYAISGVPVVSLGTLIPAWSNLPPANSLQLNQADSHGAPVPFTVVCTDLKIDTATGAIEVTIEQQFVSEVDSLLEMKDSSPSNNNYGFSVYVSKPGKQAHNFFPNPASHLIGSFLPFISAAPNVDVASINMSGTCPFKIGDFKGFGNIGEILKVDTYQTNINGMMNLAGSSLVEIKAA